jgi:tRNA uridine 5-carboxymethylaminomethyl modification enzyme
MFTSRAEFRLQLREDNADLRLTETGRRLGLVDDARWDAFCRKRDALAREEERFKASWVNPRSLPAEEAERLIGKALEREYNLADLLRRPGVGFDAVAEAGRMGKPGFDVSRETLRAEFGYAQVTALSFEARQKLAQHRPETLGQASRISGITPAAISLLLIHLRKGRFKGFVEEVAA